ncbi:MULTISPECIES: hypothetical protein [Streptomyces]|uniref:hypothetical protein n=1 Tax=Streptomyces TaxID=1883 RepID=UPI0013198CB6|nr:MULTISPECIES: hypothetical protein [Streptomyces]QGZ53247.1 hypothetical protein GPZ77_31760 [Streptomyces sp. QHH-9511]GGT86247.1 hypothetical protein GCM10010272_33940 [Streptomyces lateritius]
MRTLHIAAGVEAASLALLPANLLTTHAEVISSLTGPVHGSAYLVVIAVTWQLTGAAPLGARRRAVVPGVGGLLALRRLRASLSARA